MAKRICKECGKAKNENTGFWHQKAKNGGACFSMCKECACKFIDNKRPSTFIWILKELDMPFIEERWIDLCYKKYMKDPERFGPSSVIGTYIRTMSMKDYIDYNYDDTVKLNEENIELRRKELEVRHERDSRLARTEEDKKKVEKDAEALSAAMEEKVPDFEDSDYEIAGLDGKMTYGRLQESVGNNTKITMSNQVPQQPTMPKKGNAYQSAIGTAVDEQSILNDLTPNDVQYLAMKWGESFRPSEWLKMEEMYQKYAEEFEIGVDRESVLINMCKTNINMQRCLDAGDAANAAKFSSMFDQLRKSGAFTEAQKKEDNNKYLDSVGELVAAVEREGGAIPAFDYQFEVQPDKVDLTLKDMKSYTYNLVKNEMGLGDLIESYIKKLEEDMEMNKNKSLDDGLVTSAAEEQQTADDEYADDWLNNLESSIAAEADAVYAKIGDE